MNVVYYTARYDDTIRGQINKHRYYSHFTKLICTNIDAPHVSNVKDMLVPKHLKINRGDWILSFQNYPSVNYNATATIYLKHFPLYIQEHLIWQNFDFIIADMLKEYEPLI